MIKRILIVLAIIAMAPVAKAQEQQAFVRQNQERDSVLIGDQLTYGALLKGIKEGTMLILPQYEKGQVTEGVEVVNDWTLDTLKNKKGDLDLQASLTITSFDQGDYKLPDIKIARQNPDGTVDTLVFKGKDIAVKEMPVDTNTFVVHDLRPQIGYPLTFAEVAPYAGGVIFIIAAIFAAVLLYKRIKARRKAAAVPPEPAHIVALRQLDKLRGNKYWVPEKQKIYYSGITDALRGYIASRYEIGALEMTTAEIFDAIKGTDFPKEYTERMKELFETSDFVKFAKLTVDDDYNAKALPLAVRFVTETYQTALDQETSEASKQEPLKP